MRRHIQQRQLQKELLLIKGEALRTRAQWELQQISRPNEVLKFGWRWLSQGGQLTKWLPAVLALLPSGRVGHALGWVVKLGVAWRIWRGWQR